MYNVYQHWDPLKVCIVGKSYAPEFYSFIKNTKVRSVMERIAEETEEDYQKLITLMETFNIEVWRPEISSNNYLDYFDSFTNRIVPPPMTPRDYSAVIGDVVYFDEISVLSRWDTICGEGWGSKPKTLKECPEWILHESYTKFGLSPKFRREFYGNILDKIQHSNRIVFDQSINSAMTTRIGKDLYFGTLNYDDDTSALYKKYSQLFPEYRCHVVNTGGHSDGTFCPVVPGLIVSLKDIPTYKDTFPDWEVIYLPGQSWEKVRPFIELKRQNKGKWWVPGEELNDDFTKFVESWLDQWVGFVEETVFDVNMLVIDEKNVVCNNYNEKVFKALDRYGITPHVVNFRHRYFWDGGLHCITSDIHREGTIKDFFPNRAALDINAI